MALPLAPTDLCAVSAKADVGGHVKTRLVSYRGGKIDLAFPVQGERVTIGREADNLIQLPHEKVSTHHAVVLPSREGWSIHDLQRTNGTLINGKQATSAVLKDGDLIKIGPFELYFETNVPSDDWVPSHIIDRSSGVHFKTLPKDTPPEER